MRVCSEELGLSSLVNRNIVVGGRRTSMRFEPELWSAMSEICRREGIDAGEIVRRALAARQRGGRTSAVRVHLMEYFRSAATEDGHRKAGHGVMSEEATNSAPIELKRATGT
jgi:predicted DNA-binding ribbon-helix-helix protein